MSPGPLRAAPKKIRRGRHISYRLIFNPLSGDDAGLSRWHAEEIQFALDALARLHVHESHRRTLHKFVLVDVVLMSCSRVLYVAASSAAAAVTHQ